MNSSNPSSAYQPSVSTSSAADPAIERTPIGPSSAAARAALEDLTYGVGEVQA